MNIDPKTITLAALAIHVTMRALKAGALNEWIPGRYRPFLALALGGVAMCVDALAAGTPTEEALLSAVVAVALAMLGHDVVIEGVRGGKEIGR